MAMDRSTTLVGTIAALSGLGLVLAGCAAPAEPVAGYPSYPYDYSGGYAPNYGYPPGYAYYPPGYAYGPGFYGPGFVDSFVGFGFGGRRFHDHDEDRHHRDRGEDHHHEHGQGAHPAQTAAAPRAPIARPAMTPHGHTATSAAPHGGSGGHAGGGGGHAGSGGHGHE